ncbi:MAG: RDD family protein, partial [Steroidobacteraceae bacterium]
VPPSPSAPNASAPPPNASAESAFAGASPGSGAIGEGVAPGASASSGPGSSSTWGGPALEPLLALSQPRAGFWVRMGALFIDLVLVSFVLTLLYHHGARGTLLIVAAYAAIMWKLRGTTVGGIVFDVQVVRLDGRPINWETAIVRALACFLSLAILGLGFLWIAIDPERQAWHDKIAGTVVVRVARRVAVV